MAQKELNLELMDEYTDARWKTLYKVAGIAALITAAIIPISIVAYFIWPIYPDDIFTVIQESKLAGLMSLDFLYLFGNIFAIPAFLAFYLSLRRTDESWALLALTLGFIGLVVLIPARPVFEMLALGDQYAAATTDAQRAIIQTAGEAVLATFHGTAFNAHYILGSLSLLITAILMLRSEVYGKASAYVGIATNLVVFGLYVPVVGVYLSLLSVVGYLVWWIMLARKFFQLGRGEV
ncbi:MAG: DUF4386 family protein [Anaerolineales bacterium]|nr:DUF4386 family protein [Anaerolineales bacterium]